MHDATFVVQHCAGFSLSIAVSVHRRRRLRFSRWYKRLYVPVWRYEIFLAVSLWTAKVHCVHGRCTLHDSIQSRNREYGRYMGRDDQQAQVLCGAKGNRYRGSTAHHGLTVIISFHHITLHNTTFFL